MLFSSSLFRYSSEEEQAVIWAHWEATQPRSDLFLVSSFHTDTAWAIGVFWSWVTLGFWMSILSEHYVLSCIFCLLKSLVKHLTSRLIIAHANSIIVCFLKKNFIYWTCWTNTPITKWDRVLNLKDGATLNELGHFCGRECFDWTIGGMSHSTQKENGRRINLIYVCYCCCSFYSLIKFKLKSCQNKK